MDILDMVLASVQGDALGNLAKHNNISPTQTSQVLAQVLPELTAGLQSKVQQENGLASLLGVVGQISHQQYVDKPELITTSDAVQDGNKILGQVLGSKDASRDLASRVASSTGVNDSVIKKLLPMAATLLMGVLGQRGQSGSLTGMLSGVLSGEGDPKDRLDSVLGALMGGGRNNQPQEDTGGIVNDVLSGFFNK